MRWRERIKVIEFGLGLGLGATVLWLWLSLILVTGLASLDPAPGKGTGLLVVLAQDAGLVLSMAVAGLIGGLLLVGGRLFFALTANLVAVVSRATVYIVNADPEPPWRSFGEATLHAVLILAAVLVCAWMFRLAGKWTSRGGPPGVVSGRNHKRRTFGPAHRRVLLHYAPPQDEVRETDRLR